MVREARCVELSGVGTHAYMIKSPSSLPIGQMVLQFSVTS